MIKGFRWNFIVLILISSVWISLSLQANDRRKRQLRGAIYPPPSRKARYFPTVPMHILPYLVQESEPIIFSSTSSEGKAQFPWVPMDMRKKKLNKNIYMPPIRPPTSIITRKPFKNTFNVPLTKSIQVSPGKPNIQSSGYVRKNVVKTQALKVTTEHPGMNMLGTLAESTVQSLLDFTSVDEPWRPKKVFISKPTTEPNFGENLGSKVEKHLNYTGLRFGKINSVTRSMPQNGAAVKMSKNETNFLMKFTPEDIKFSSVEVKTEKINSPFTIESPEVKHLARNTDRYRLFFDEFSNSEKSVSDLNREANIPYQQHKSSIQNAQITPTTKTNINDRNRKIHLNLVPHTQIPNNVLKKEKSGQESFIGIPIRSENENAPVKLNESYQKVKTYVIIPNKNREINSMHGNAQGYSDYPNQFNNLYAEQKMKSNLPHEGHYVDNKPQILTNLALQSNNQRNEDREFNAHSSNNSPKNPVIVNNKEREYKGQSNDEKNFKPQIFTNSNFQPNNQRNPDMESDVYLSNNFNKNPVIISREKENKGHSNAEKNFKPQILTNSNFQPNNQRNPEIESNVNLSNNFDKNPVIINREKENKGHSNAEKNFKPQILTNSALQQYNLRNPDRESDVHLNNNVAKNPVTLNKENEHKVHLIDEKNIYDVSFNPSPNTMPINYATSVPFSSQEDSVSANRETYKYDPPSNTFVPNKTLVKNIIYTHKNSANLQNQPTKDVPTNMPKREEINKIRVGDKSNTVPKIKDMTANKTVLGTISSSSIPQNDIKPLHERKKEGSTLRDELKSSLDDLPKLKDIELKNPPKYLQFGDADFLIPLNPDKKPNYDKTTSDLKSAVSGKHSESSHQQNANAFNTRNFVKITHIPTLSSSQLSSSKVEYYENSKNEEKKPFRETEDGVYFQPVFPDVYEQRNQDNFQHRFQNYNTNERPSLQSIDNSKELAHRPNTTNKPSDTSKSPQYDTSREKYGTTVQKINKNVIITKATNYSPEIKNNAVQKGMSNDFPRIITPPPLITVNYNSLESVNDMSKKGSGNRQNHSDNYVIQYKPGLLPESSGRPRKPKITISTGMLAGILIAALIFLGFLTGSMVYAFHQWKFGRSRGRRPKTTTTRSPGFPPEYLDENFAGNTYIHNNIFLPTPQNIEERNPSDHDSNSVIGDDVVHEQPSIHSRSRRHRAIREIRDI